MAPLLRGPAGVWNGALRYSAAVSILTCHLMSGFLALFLWHWMWKLMISASPANRSVSCLFQPWIAAEVCVWLYTCIFLSLFEILWTLILAVLLIRYTQSAVVPCCERRTLLAWVCGWEEGPSHNSAASWSQQSHCGLSPPNQLLVLFK